MNLLGQNDPRSMQGMLSRGSNTYQGMSNSPWAGKITQNSPIPGNPLGGGLTGSMRTASMLPQYQKLSLQDVARKALSGGVR